LSALWEQRPGESAKAYQAFCIYRDLGPRRSVDQASRLYHQTSRTTDAAPARRRRASGTIRGWANQWQWSARATAWDAEQTRVYEAARIVDRREMDERQARLAMMLQQKGIERLRQLRPEELKPREALNYMMEAAKLERMARSPTVPVPDTRPKTPWWVSPVPARD
jgi:hypothetical protein